MGLKAQQGQVNLEGTERIEIKSTDIGENYELWVSLPFGYAQSTQTYKTLYVLDANVTFGMIRDIQTLMSFEPGNPPLIIVGIAYSGLNEWIGKRSRDYMANQVATIPGSGGAGKYLSFLESEVIPAIEKRYRATDERIIYGHSTAALFGYYSLAEKPDLFKGYILTSPSVDEDAGYTLAHMKEWVKPSTSKQIRVYTSVGTEEKMATQNAVAQLNTIMMARQETALTYQFENVKGTHMNSMAQSFINGLLFVNKVQ